MSTLEPQPSIMEDLFAINALERISDVFIALNLDWQIIYFNSIAVDFFKISSTELIGKPFFDVLPGKTSKNFITACNRAIETQEHVIIEEFISAKQEWVEYHLYPSDSGVSIIIQNITLRKQAELCLQENEQQYRQIINTSNEGIWILDKHFKTTYVNNHLAEMFGYQPDEMIGHRVEDFLFPEEWEDHQRRIHNRKIGIKERYDRRFRRKDGSALWVIISATPIFNDGNVFQGSFAMFTDITDRIQAEQALAEKEQLLSAMSRMAKIGAWEFDPVTLKGTWTEETARIHDLDPDRKSVV